MAGFLARSRVSGVTALAHDCTYDVPDRSRPPPSAEPWSGSSSIASSPRSGSRWLSLRKARHPAAGDRLDLAGELLAHRGLEGPARAHHEVGAAELGELSLPLGQRIFDRDEHPVAADDRPCPGIGCSVLVALETSCARNRAARERPDARPRLASLERGIGARLRPCRRGYAPLHRPRDHAARTARSNRRRSPRSR